MKDIMKRSFPCLLETDGISFADVPDSKKQIRGKHAIPIKERGP